MSTTLYFITDKTWPLAYTLLWSVIKLHGLTMSHHGYQWFRYFLIQYLSVEFNAWSRITKKAVVLID